MAPIPLLEAVEQETIRLLKEERMRQALSATQLATAIKVSRAAITHIEAGRCRPTVWMILRISAGLNLDIVEVLREARRLASDDKAAPKLYP